MKNTVIEVMKNATAGALGLAISYLGGFDNALHALLAVMMIDFMTGIMKGVAGHRVSSNRAYKGIKKKAVMLMIIIIANQLDNLVGVVGETITFRLLFIYYYIGMEGISITENAEAIGVPVHPKLKQILESYTTKNGGEND